MSNCPTCGHETFAPEPGDRSIVTDADGDAWQHLDDGWNSVIHDPEYRAVPWEELNRQYGPLSLVS